MLLTALAACTGDDNSEHDADPSSAPSPEATAATPWRDVTSELGLDFVHRAGPTDAYAMPTVMGGGACLLDYDSDGLLDLYFVQAGDHLRGDRSADDPADDAANQLYRQTEDGTFRDVTATAGGDDRGYGMGCAVGDIDNDGDLDLFVSNWGADVLYRNDGGRLVEVTRTAGLGDEAWSASAVFFDYDLDGWLDLYVTRYVRFDPDRECRLEGDRRGFCGPAQFPGEHDLLYRNLGNGRFEERSAVAGLVAIADRGLGTLAADLDDDGLPDVYVANDSDPNQLWINQGDGTFVDDALLLGLALNRYGVGEAGMGVAIGDPDADLDLDVFVSHLIEETNTLYENRGEVGFEDASGVSGLGVASLSYTGFGTAFFDHDNDGDLDLAVVNGAVKERPETLSDRSDWFWAPYAEPNLLFENEGNGHFRDVSDQTGSYGAELEVSRALLPADLDGDGDLDLVITNIAGAARIYRNEGTAASRSVTLTLIDPELRRESYGARVLIETPKRTVLRIALPLSGYLSSGPATVHVGLGEESGVERVEVVWPGDESAEVFDGFPAGSRVTLRRGEGSG